VYGSLRVLEDTNFCKLWFERDTCDLFKREKGRVSMGNNPFAEKTAYYLGTENSNSEWLRRFIIKHNRHPANRVPSWELPRLRMIVDILSRIEESKSDDIMNLFESISETDFSAKKTTTQEADTEIKRMEDAYPKVPTITFQEPSIEFGQGKLDEPALLEFGQGKLDEPALLEFGQGKLDEPALLEFGQGKLNEDPLTEDPLTEDPLTEDPLTEEPSLFFIHLDSMFGKEIEEYFDWPSTEVNPSWFGMSNLDSSEWPKIGVLKRMGYSVASKGPITDSRRKEILDYIFQSERLPFVHSYEHMMEWGAAKSVARLKKIANSMASFGRNMRRKGMNNPLRKYDEDLAYLKETYYLPLNDSWNWPSTYDY
jgi:hypothetical protein